MCNYWIPLSTSCGNVGGAENFTEMLEMDWPHSLQARWQYYTTSLNLEPAGGKESGWPWNGAQSRWIPQRNEIQLVAVVAHRFATIARLFSYQPNLEIFVGCWIILLKLADSCNGWLIVPQVLRRHCILIGGLWLLQHINRIIVDTDFTQIQYV